jgi:hypothetical protein
MSKSFSYSKKKKLANTISKLKTKEDMINIMNIISADSVNITENQNGLFLIFDNLSDGTYHKIEEYLMSLKGVQVTSSDYISDSSSEKKSYASYCNEDAMNTQNIKYTSKERNIIKRQRYENSVNEINN